MGMAVVVGVDVGLDVALRQWPSVVLDSLLEIFSGRVCDGDTMMNGCCGCAFT